jgi:hypothetical protein
MWVTPTRGPPLRRLYQSGGARVRPVAARYPRPDSAAFQTEPRSWGAAGELTRAKRTGAKGDAHASNSHRGLRRWPGMRLGPEQPCCSTWNPCDRLWPRPTSTGAGWSSSRLERPGTKCGRLRQSRTQSHGHGPRAVVCNLLPVHQDLLAVCERASRTFLDRHRQSLQRGAALRLSIRVGFQSVVSLRFRFRRAPVAIIGHRGCRR